MKKKIGIFVLGFLWHVMCISQIIPAYHEKYKSLRTFNKDTLRYLLESFVDRKEVYIEKPLDEIFNDLEITIKSYTPAFLKQGEWLYFGSYFKFNDASEKSTLESNYKDNPKIWVEWKGVPMDSINILRRKNNSKWTIEARKYFGKLIVKDFKILNFYSWRKTKVCPNIADVYYFILQRQLYNTERITYQLDDGTKYGLSTYNPLLMVDFLSKFSNRGLLDIKTNNINFNTEVGKIYKDVLIYFQNPNFDPIDALQKGYTAYQITKGSINPEAQALAYILKKYETGIVLLRVGSNAKYYSVYDNKWHAP